MATLTKGRTKSGATSWIVQYFAGRQRKTIRLPLSITAETTAAEAALHIGHLAAAQQGLAVDAITGRWVAGLRGPLRQKLIDVGLIERPLATTLGPFTRAYIDGRSDVKPRTKINFEQARKYLLQRFGEHQPLAAITPADAEDYRRWLREQGLGENTTRRHCGRAKQFFRFACRKRLLTDNPFGDMAKLDCGASHEDRDYFITRDEADKVLQACPDAQWQLLFALSRFGGLRCPSEHFELNWADIDFNRGRMRVRSTKTAHHEGKESRLVPIFPELRPYLLAAYEESAAEAGPDRVPSGAVITIARLDRYANVGSRLRRIVERAGLKPWPKLTHNLRASRETELNEVFPEHVVCAWIGHNKRVAHKHYLRVNDSHFDRAICSAGPSGAAAASGGGGKTLPAPLICQDQSSTVGRIATHQYPLPDLNRCYRTENPGS